MDMIGQPLRAWRDKIPASALARADADDNPRDREWIRGDVAAEQRAALRSARAALWAETLRTWPDDDLTGALPQTLQEGQKPTALAAWVRDQTARVLVLSGKTGRGKTYAAFALGNVYGAQGWHVAAISHKRYLDSLEPGGSDEPAFRIRRRVQLAEVLIIDGFGDEMDPCRPASEFRARETADVISARLGKGKRTIITTNLVPDELALMFGERVISRLRQRSVAVLIEGEDRRNGANW